MPHTRSKIMDDMKKRTTLFAVLMLWCSWLGAQGQAQLNLPRVKLQAGIQLLDVQLAQTPQQREIGLMHRSEMPNHEGMLFVFEQKSRQCFWMKNTLIPLTADFLEDDGTIVNLADMAPQTTQAHCSIKPVRYVLEVNQGWFAKRKVGPGDRIVGLP